MASAGGVISQSRHLVGVLVKLAGRSILIAAALALSAAAAAGPFEDAVAAYQRGDYATAYALTRPLADEGVARAQFNLGVMYAKGQGVAQDYAEAAKWYRLAADQGHAGGSSISA